jgi:hypothetical protein
MKKLSMMLAMLLVVCFAVSAVAEDRLSWSGAFRARAWYKDNLTTANKDDKSDREEYWDQRFRVAMKINIAEGITGNLRMDFSENTWGQTTNESRRWQRGESDNTDRQLNVDRAYVRIDKEMFTFNVGHQFLALGKQMVTDGNHFGLNLRLKLPVDLYGQYAKITENDSRTDQDEFDSEDEDYFGGQVVYKGEGFSVGGLAATIQDRATSDDSPYAFGIFGDATFGALSLVGEADFFGGDAGAGRDYFGSQVWVAGKYAITPAFWLGLDGWYAAGKNDPNKVQATTITDGADTWSLSDKGPFRSDILPLGATYGNSRGLPEMDPAASSGGAIGGVLSAGYRIVEPLLAEGSLFYVAPENTRNTDLNSIFIANIFGTYDWYENTQVAGGYLYKSEDRDNRSTDPAHVLVLRLQLKF